MKKAQQILLIEKKTLGKINAFIHIIKAESTVKHMSNPTSLDMNHTLQFPEKTRELILLHFQVFFYVS